MSDLAALQARFQAGILSPDNDAAPDGINAGARETASALFAIYRHAYAARLVEVLQANFDKTWGLLGDEGFDSAARAYIASAPSTFRNARWYGRGFAGFLTRYHNQTPAVAEVAAMDWAIAAAFDAPDAPACGVEAMAAFHPQEWPELRFTLHPAVHRLSASTPAAAIYQALTAGDAPVSLEPVPPHGVLVWRDGLTVRYRALDEAEDLALASLAAGCSFATICEALAGCIGPDTAGSHAATLLRLWLESGMISSVSAATEGLKKIQGH